MENYDYYTIKAAWKGAGVSQRADDLKAAEKIADDLRGNGFLDVVIFGVKAGKREKLEGDKKAGPKARKRRGKAAKPKAQAKAATKVKKPINARKKQDKKAHDNAGQLDLFANTDKKKDEIWRFDLNELNFISMALKEFFPEYIKEPLKLTTKEYDELINCFERAKMRGGNINIKLNENETKNIIRSLNWFKKQEHVYNKEYIQEIIDGLNYGNYMV